MSSIAVMIGLGAIGMIGVTEAQAQVTRYRLDVVNTWSTSTHPGLFPEDAHFSWIGGGTHNNQTSFWEEGVPASPGMKQMAEDGSTFILRDEVSAEVNTGNVGNVLSWRHWFCPGETTDSRCGPTSVEFDIDADHPLVTLATMLGPSPDWFVGVSGLSLLDQNGDWEREVVVDLRPYDAGTRSANRWELFGPLENPPLPIHLITTELGQLVGPDSLGTMTFTFLIPEPSSALTLIGLGALGIAQRTRRKRDR